MLIGVRVNRTGYLDRILPNLPPTWRYSKCQKVDRLYSLSVGDEKTKQRGIRRLNVLYGGVVVLGRSKGLDDLLEGFAADLRLYVAENSPIRTFIHAGVVGWKGQAILIPGRSYTGKSTLVAEMVKAGAEYYSDEYAVIDSKGRAHPYPKPISIRENGEFQQKSVSVQQLGGRTGRRPLKPGLVVVTKYKDFGRFRPRALTPGMGVLELMKNTVSARVRPGNALSRFGQFASEADFVKGTRGEARNTAPAILRAADRKRARG